MLNITKNRIDQFVKIDEFKSTAILKEQKYYKVIRKIIWAFVVLVVLFLFLPWTQNIQGTGNVTTLKPNQRPQTIQTVIAGRIEKWYINEGDFVKKGDTILITGPTTGAQEMLVKDMMVNDLPLEKATKGDSCTLKVPFRIRLSDKMYKIVAN